jgi:hypothetical protein
MLLLKFPRDRNVLPNPPTFAAPHFGATIKVCGYPAAQGAV